MEEMDRRYFMVAYLFVCFFRDINELNHVSSQDRTIYSKENGQPVRLSYSKVPCTEGPRFGFSARAHAQVAGLTPGGGT